MEQNSIIDNIFNLIVEKTGTLLNPKHHREVIMSLLPCLHRMLSEETMARIDFALSQAAQNEMSLPDLYKCISQETALPFLRFQERKWNPARKRPYHQDKITEEEHCQMVMNDLELLNKANFIVAYHYFNGCRKPGPPLDQTAFRDLWLLNIMMRKDPEFRKRQAAVALFHDYGKLTHGPDHPQDGAIVMESLIERLDFDDLNRKYILAEIKNHDLLFAMSSGENVPMNVTDALGNDIDRDTVLKELVTLQLVDSNNIGGVASEFLEERGSLKRCVSWDRRW